MLGLHAAHVGALEGSLSSCRVQLSRTGSLSPPPMYAARRARAQVSQRGTLSMGTLGRKAGARCYMRTLASLIMLSPCETRSAARVSEFHFTVNSGQG